MEAAGLGELVGLDMLVEPEIELVEVAGLELELELAGPAGLVGIDVLAYAELELVEPAELVGVAVLGAAELVAFAALEPGFAGLSDLAEPATPPLAQLALGNDAERYSR